MSDKPTMWEHTGAELNSRWAVRYDEIETGTDDIELIRRLIGDRGQLRMLEPMCGTGRILIPMAMDGHQVVGLDISQAMLDRAREKIAKLPAEVGQRISLIHADITSDDWPQDFDAVILGGNWAFQLPSPEVQEMCIASAAASLRLGSYLFHDSDHMDGELSETWRELGVIEGKPWTTSDGVVFQPTSETLWFDAEARLHRSRRRTMVTFPDGSTKVTETTIQKHPVSRDEIRGWLDKHGFTIEWADETPGRIKYWARKSDDRLRPAGG